MSTVSATIKILDGFTSPLDKLNSKLSQGQSMFSRFKSGMAGANPFSSLNKSAAETGGVFKSVLGANVIGGGISKGIGIASSGIGSMIGELNDSSKAWQTFNGNMSMIGQSPKQISAARGSLSKFAQQTIYSASDMASTYSQLAAVGTKNTTSLVKGFGGLASASEDPAQAMKTLSQQATQMAAMPKVQWADFKLMMQQSPAGMAAVAKTMHRSTAQLVQDIQNGKVKTQDFFNAVSKAGTNKGFTKMATQFKTVGQAVDGLKEGVAIKLQDAFDSASQVGIKMVSSLSDSINKIDFKPIADGAMNAFKTVVANAKQMWAGFTDTGAIKSVQSMFTTLGASAKRVFGKLAGGGKNPFKSFGELAGNTIKGAAKSISAVADAVSKLSPGTLKTIGAAFVVMKSGMQGLKFTVLIAGLNALSKMSPGQIKAVAVAVGLVVTAMKGFQALKGIRSALSMFQKTPKVPEIPVPEPGKTGAAATSMLKLGIAMVLIGAGAALAGAGLLMIANATIKLVSAGWPAIAMFFGMIAAVAVLAVIVKLLGPSLIGGAVGFLILGAALLLIGIAVLLASAGLALLATQLPLISQYGVSAAIGLLALAGAVAVFGLAAIVAAVGLILLGASLLILGVGFVIAAVGALLFAVAMAAIVVTVIIAAVGMLMLAITLPLIAVFSMIAAVGLLLMSVALTVIAVTGLIAGVGMMILAVSMVLLAPLSMLAAIGLLLLGVAMTMVAVTVMIAAVGMMILAVAMPLVAVFSMVAAIGLLLMSVALMGIAATGLIAGVGMMLLAVSLMLVAPMSLVAAVGIMMLGVALMLVMAGAMMAFTGLVMVMAGAMMAMAGLMLVMAGGMMAMVGLTMVMMGAMMAMIGLAAIVLVAAATALVLAGLGIAAAASAIGMAALGVATKLVATQVASIANKAASAAASLKTMVSAVSVVKTGLNTLGSIARDAVNKFVSAFKGGTGNARSAAHALVNAATSAMKSGVSAARSAGAMISAGLAAGMRSRLGTVTAAANALIAQANRAARAAAKIHSPSRLFAEIGDYMGQGMAIGMNGTSSLISKAGAKMATSAVSAANIDSSLGNFGLTGLNPGDQLAAGFNRALEVIGNVSNAINGMSGSSITANGQIQFGATGSHISDVPATTPFGDNARETVTANHYGDASSMVVQVQPGAIQVVSSGNGALDGETIARELENYLIRKNGTAMS
ncbi:tape measure protein [Lactiplantibacillus paraplantarum]|uniref:tape measure protein n=1 Tax=Lactiplantibacillus paraplantarum TaxID=60520 RepID=UPI002551F2BE|nr:tape measure protein [Lactiplantibacillus paraplantarum]MDL2061100.1 tape measure protein [Lactiplantibacillus paraplantarum]